MFILTVCSVDSLRRLRIVTTAIVLLSLILVFQGIAAYHFGYKETTFLYDPSTRGASTSASDDEPDEGGNLLPAESSESADDDDAESDQVVRIRGLGVLHDPNDLAAGLVVALALLGAGWVPGARLRNVLLVVAPGIAFGYGVFLTHSRGGTLALVVTLAGTFARRLKRQTTILVMIGLLGAVVAMDFAGGRKLLSPSDESASERITAWTEGLEMLKSSPILGIGYGQFFEYHTLTAHNSLVLCFAETGIVGYFSWLGLLVITFGQLHGLSSIAGEEPVDATLRNWAATLQLALLGFMTAAFFLSRTYIPMLYLVVGLSVALILIARQLNRPVWSPALPRLAAIVLGSEAASILVIYVVVKLRLM